MNRSIPLLFAVGLVTVACDRNKAPAGADAGAPVAVTSASPALPTAPARDGGAPGVPWAAIPSATAAVLANMSLPERFDVEKTSRPVGIKPNAEAVFSALEQAGLTIVDRKQHLASPFGARYCIGARATGGQTTLVHVSVCEYGSPELAKMGRDYSDDTLKGALSNRSVLANKQVTLTMRLEDKAPANDAAAEKAAAAFAKL